MFGNNKNYRRLTKSKMMVLERAPDTVRPVPPARPRLLARYVA
jgi:hypothetical protein